MKCLHCKKETKNPSYCSRTCAAIRTNSLYPKRKRVIKNCIVCGKETALYHRSKYCNEHKPSATRQNRSLSEVIYTKHHQSSAFALVRNSAKYLYFCNNEKKCKNCGYNKHVEVCHIKPISKFSKNAKLSTINHPDNLIGLCPNCHWEFDHGLLKI